MSLLKSLIFIFLLFSISCSNTSMDSDKAIKILDEYILKTGGKKIYNINSFKSVGEWIMADSQKIHHEYIVLPPNKLYSKSLGQSINEKSIYNKGQALMVRNGTLYSMDKWLLNETELDAYIFPLAYRSELIDEITFLGDTLIKEHPFSIIKIDFENNRSWKVFFNKEYQIHSIERTNLTMIYSDYRTVNGIEFPFSTTYLTEEAGKLTYRRKSIQLNQKVDTSIFNINTIIKQYSK